MLNVADERAEDESGKVVIGARPINDWTTLVGASVEIRLQGRPVGSGHVDAVTEDGSILWLQAPAENRRLYEKAEFYEAWANEYRTGFHYRISRGAIAGTPSGTPI